MSEVQREAYEDADEILSDPWGLWDRDNRNHRKKQDLILARTAAAAGDRVLEVGCGHGLHARRYAQRFKYVGVDLSSSLIATALDVAPDATFLVGDATDLPHPADHFDAVVGTAILHHLPDVHTALAEWRRVVRPGGSITLCEPNYLFPLETISAHTQPEEQHKTQMAPWRLRRALATVDCRAWTLDPYLYTPPWPRRLHGVYDRIDAVLGATPGVRWLSQMLLIHVDV